MKFIKSLYYSVSILSIGLNIYYVYDRIKKNKKESEDLVSSLSENEKKKLIVKLLSD